MTAGAVAVSIFVFAALASFATITDQILAQSGARVRLVCHNKEGLGHGLPEAYGPKIRAMPHVRAMCAWNFFGSRYRRPDETFPTIDLDVDDIETLWPEWGIAPATLARFRKIRTAAMVAPALMRKYRWRIGDKVSLLGVQDLIPVTLEIVGELGPGAPENYFIFRRDYLKEVYHQLPHRVQPEYDVDFFWIKPDTPAASGAVIAEIDRSFDNSAYETITESEASFVTNLVSSLGVVFTVARALCAIVLAVLILVAANTAAMSARERRAEIAVMRAIGFSRASLVAIIAGESLTLALAGGALGCTGAYAALRIAEVGSEILGPFGPLRMPGGAAAFALAASAAAGALAGLLPALSATRRPVADSLRAVA